MKLTNEQIRKIALANGFKLKTQFWGGEGLNPYVYDFARALLDQAIPEGYALAPVEPTQKMIDSCHHGFMVITDDTQWNDVIKATYKQMIKAEVLGL